MPLVVNQSMKYSSLKMQRKSSFIFILLNSIFASHGSSDNFTQFCYNQGWCHISNITKFDLEVDLKNCGIQERFHSIKNLQISDFESDEKFPKISKCFSSLNFLLINKVGLKYFPDLKNMENLKEINLQENQLKSIDDEIFKSNQKIEKIILSKNQISVIDPKALKDLKNLIYLDLSENFLTLIDENLFQHNEKLETILLNRNNFTKINWKIFKPLEHLIYLNIYETFWTVEGSSDIYSLNSLIEALSGKRRNFEFENRQLSLNSSASLERKVESEKFTRSTIVIIVLVLCSLVLGEFFLILTLFLRNRKKSYTLEVEFETEVETNDDESCTYKIVYENIKPEGENNFASDLTEAELEESKVEIILDEEN